jgi:hypothetical protein
VDGEAIETLPLPFPTVLFVITGVFDAVRFVRLASATSGESAAEAVAATSRARIRAVRRMKVIVTEEDQ